ncbi:DHH family phosphoesterase [Roseomonas indoligenes]|uniref:DHH family phosphoesterase n=1 Tax=Roseomonas indoligenes TaxID=2820811 RepID=A0A940MZ49_9PROT|nr:DHH family phosphoesterase [Pararoseomonas indoligenes]MBP0492365.1 DHH family phosphoesterase [Pararoseomonas indoligenes]
MTPAEARAAFEIALRSFDASRPPLILCHHDADGLAAGAILARALPGAGTRVIGRGEGAWTEETAAEVRARDPGGLLVTDLGTRADAVVPGLPTAVLDHHVPIKAQAAEGVTVIAGHDTDPQPCSALIAHWCAGGEDPWLAAIGILGDFGDKAPFPELAEARKRHGIGVLKEAVALLNAPRRASSGDASPALALLLRANGPREVIDGSQPEAAVLAAARDEVRAALDAARRVPPKVVGDVALIRIHTPCQVHPLVAQSWVSRLRGKVVICANTGYREGWVHFAARSSDGRDLIAFLRERAPEGAGENFAQGHARATGGMLQLGAWDDFLGRLGYPPG